MAGPEIGLSPKWKGFRMSQMAPARIAAPDRGGPDHPSQTGRLPRFLGTVVAAAATRPRLTLSLVLAITLLAIGFSATSLRFKTSRSDLIDPGADFQRRWLRYVGTFGDQNDMVVVVEARNAAAIQTILDDIGRRIEADAEHFQSPLYRIDSSPLGRKGLQYLPPEALETLAAHLEVYAPVISGNWQRAGLDPYSLSLVHLLKQSERAGKPPSFSGEAKSGAGSLLAQCELLAASLEAFVRDPANPASFRSPWPRLAPDAASPPAAEAAPRYLMNAAGTMGFLIASPRKLEGSFSGYSESIRRMRQIVEAARREYETLGARLGLTGIPVLESDEMARSQGDMSWATLISFGGVLAILLTGFRGFRHPLLAILMLAAGSAWALGLTTLTIGHLTILTVSFAAILAGLGIDFAIHFLSRYLSLRHQGDDLLTALRRTGETVGTGILTCAITTALAFAAAAFTSFRGVAELGLISAAGILCCGLAAFVVLPPLIAVADRGRSPQRLPVPLQMSALRWMTRSLPGPLAAGGILLSAGLAAFAFDWTGGLPRLRVGYDGNLLRMQARGLESVEIQERLFRESDNSLLYAVSIAPSPAEARRLAAKFRALPSVGRVEEIASMVPRYPASETQLLLQAIHARLSGLTALPGSMPVVDPKTAGTSLERLYETLAARPEPAAKSAAASLDRFLDLLTSLPVDRQVVLLNGYQHGMLASLHEQFRRLTEAADPAPLTPADLPAGLRNRFVSPRAGGGEEWLLRVFPREQVWEEAPLARFVAEVRTVDPEVTGTPLQNHEASAQIRRSYLDAAAYSLAVVVLLLLLDLLRPVPRLAMILAPAAVGAFALWIAPEHAAISEAFGRFAVPAVGVAIAVAILFDPRNVGLAALAMMPPLVGGAMLVGAMGVLAIDFNPANMIVLPLLMGIGVDYGVLLIHDFREQKERYAISSSTLSSLMMTSTTTMAGFGSLLIASHRGLASLGLVLLVGMACTLFVAVVPLAGILSLLASRREAAASGGPIMIQASHDPERFAPSGTLAEAG